MRKKASTLAAVIGIVSVMGLLSLLQSQKTYTQEPGEPKVTISTTQNLDRNSR